MEGSIVVPLDDDLARLLDEVCECSRKGRDEVVYTALRRQLSLMRFEQMRARLRPYAEAVGYLTDEDVYRDVS